MVTRADVVTFLKFYLAAAVALSLLSLLLSVLLTWSFLPMYATVLAVIGFAYVASSVLAWSGVANLYRFSPTLLVGSGTYRSTLAQRGSTFWSEGRDTEALLRGLCLGAALMGTGAALSDPLFLLADAVGVAAVVLLLWAVRPRGAGRAAGTPSQGPR